MKSTYIKAIEAQKLLGVSNTTFYKLIEQNILPSIRTGDKLRVNRADVEALNRTGWVWNANSQAD
ncbi:excisionase family DNA-binding protein [Deinococcus phoenicis]|uniref:excisionase family DNA-binding protein n=1 Tax=Deinococcus phoenicis TaxID=1476583 RepID=UPI0009DF7561